MGLLRVFRALLVLPCWVSLGSAAPLLAGTVIYDNTANPTRITAFTQLLIGDEVIAAGTGRTVIKLEVGAYAQHHAITSDFEAWLYANDGRGGAPGTMLWQSERLDNYQLTGEYDLVEFQVPDIVVPDRFTWFIRTSDHGVGVGPIVYTSPAIGSSPEYCWFGSLNNWGHLGPYYGTPMDLMARITVQSIPEPGTATLASLVLIMLGVVRRLSRSRHSRHRR